MPKTRVENFHDALPGTLQIMQLMVKSTLAL
jgi:hypothetical protein